MTNTHTVYLALGSNLGNRQENLKTALYTLPPHVEISAVSRLYQTEPAYVLDQPTFLNVVARGHTRLQPQALLAYLKQIEAELGRKKIIRFGPRKIDLDIIFYEDWVVDTFELQIPHPRMAERGFVLRPLVELDPHLVHPVLKRPVKELLANLPPDEGILSVTEWEPLA